MAVGNTPRLAGATGAVTGMAVGVAVVKEEADTVGEENTLLHWETLFVVTAGDAEDVPFPFVAENVPGNFLRDPLVVEDAAFDRWVG
jgi:hypothetical protein